ncbi:MAG: hypothetical protein ACI4RV_02480 [Eubacteriales bacterium]
MEDFISANSTPGASDDQSISLAIRKAKETGVNRVVIPRDNERTGTELWLIEHTVKLPNDIEILFENAHLRLADNTFCNMFANEALGTERGRTPAGEQHNITLRGIGNAVLDGGTYNGLSELNSEKDGRPHISVNTTLLFCNVRALTVENLNIINQRWWGITNIFVRESVFRNIHFQADLSRIDADGVHHPDELPRNYAEIYVKNADGIDLRIGCHDILIENITGFTEDDSVALTALGKFERHMGYTVEGRDTDIHDVRIRHVATDPYICSVIRLLNDNGNKLYHIDIDGVTHLRTACDRSQTVHAVRIGDMAYAEQHSSLGDTYGISVRNVSSHAVYAVSLCKGLKDSRIENVTVLEGGKYGFAGVPGGNAVLRNCTLERIFAAVPGSEAIAEGSFRVE